MYEQRLFATKFVALDQFLRDLYLKQIFRQADKEQTLNCVIVQLI